MTGSPGAERTFSRVSVVLTVLILVGVMAATVWVLSQWARRDQAAGAPSVPVPIGANLADLSPRRRRDLSSPDGAYRGRPYYDADFFLRDPHTDLHHPAWVIEFEGRRYLVTDLQVCSLEEPWVPKLIPAR